jgi:hypothetical protein
MFKVEESVKTSSSMSSSALEMVNGEVVSSQEKAERLATEHLASALKHGDEVRLYLWRGCDESREGREAGH